MSRLATYFAFAKAHPTLFVNPPKASFTILLDEDEIHEVEAQKAQELEARGFPTERATEYAQVGIVYEDQYVRVLRDAVRFPSGKLGTYIRFAGKEDAALGVVVLPLYRSSVLLVRRFHHTTRTWHLEIPLAPGMKGLSAEEIARRELAKEIGVTLSCLTSLGQINFGPGMASNKAELFYAEVESYGSINTNEGIAELLQVEVPEFERLICESQITDRFTILAYTHAKFRGLLEMGKK